MYDITLHLSSKSNKENKIKIKIDNKKE